VNELVTSLVNDLLMPVLFQPALQAAGVDDVRALNVHGIFYGKAVSSFIDFLIVAFLVFLLVKYAFRENLLAKK
jgi:large conductance mechanosensitive channel